VRELVELGVPEGFLLARSSADRLKFGGPGGSLSPLIPTVPACTAAAVLAHGGMA